MLHGNISSHMLHSATSVLGAVASCLTPAQTQTSCLRRVNKVGHATSALLTHLSRLVMREQMHAAQSRISSHSRVEAASSCILQHPQRHVQNLPTADKPRCVRQDPTRAHLSRGSVMRPPCTKPLPQGLRSAGLQTAAWPPKPQ